METETRVDRQPVSQGLVLALVLSQVAAVIGIAALLWAMNRPTMSDLFVDIESVAVVGGLIISLALFLAGQRVLRTPLTTPSRAAVVAGTSLTGMCGLMAVAAATIVVVVMFARVVP